MASKVAVVVFHWGEWPEDRPELARTYISRLYNSLMRNSTVKFDFLLFSDKPRSERSVAWFPPIEVIPRQFASLRWNLKKMAMFDSMGLQDYDQVIAMDLDMVITGDIDFLLQHRSDILFTCRAAYSDDVGGSVVGFDPREPWTTSLVRFLLDYREILEDKTGGSERKFYRILKSEMDFPIRYWQDTYPNAIHSFKVDGYKNYSRIVRFHGKPRPHEVWPQPKWIAENWR